MSEDNLRSIFNHRDFWPRASETVTDVLVNRIPFEELDKFQSDMLAACTNQKQKDQIINLTNLVKELRLRRWE